MTQMRTIIRETPFQITEKLLQRDKGEGQYICDFGGGGVHAIKHILFFFNRRFLLVVGSSYHYEGF